MKKQSKYSDSAKIAFISIVIITLIITSQIPTIKTYLSMIDFTSITLLEALTTIVVSTMVYVTIETIYNNSKK
ncbi:MAG: hypothetical protein Tsb0033_27520 [Winogradskyella sp.]